MSVSEPPRPVAEAERIESLDVLRGLGVLGILMVNVGSFGLPPEVSSDPTLSPFPFEGAAAATWWAIRTLFEGKFLALFSMLFGVSLLLAGGAGGDRARERVLDRRLRWLAVFGALHGALIWFGDILLHYAIFGAIAARCRGLPVRWLLPLAAVGFLAGVGLITWSETGAAALGDPGAVRQQIALYRTDLVGLQNWNLMFFVVASVASAILYGPLTLGLMLFGMALFRSGWLQGRAPARHYAGAVAAAAATLVVIGLASWGEIAGGFDAPVGPWWRLPNLLLGPVVTLGYAAAVLLALRRRWFRPAARVLGAVGRMAFTNYIAQSVLMTGLFYGGRGFGLYGSFDWPQLALAAAAFWALQLVWSPLWLSRFTMGPLEWLWRRLSYGADLPLKRRPLEDAARPAA